MADNSSLELIGAHFLTITARSGHKSEQLVYFATDIGEFYLSKAALIDLAVIDSNFPQPGSCPDKSTNPSLPYYPQHGVHNYEAQDGSTSELRLSPGVHTPGQGQQQVTQQQSTRRPASAQGIVNSTNTFNNSKGQQDTNMVYLPGNW